MVSPRRKTTTRKTQSSKTQSSKSPGVDAQAFGEKVANLPRWAGRAVMEKALLLYLVLTDPKVPLWAKAVVAGALALFISPVDAIPDVVPLAGFTDDGAVMAAALAQVAAHVDRAHRAAAKRRARRLLGE